jgi:hypothetical protein
MSKTTLSLLPEDDAILLSIQKRLKKHHVTLEATQALRMGLRAINQLSDSKILALKDITPRPPTGRPRKSINK